MNYWRIPLADVDIGISEKEAVMAVLDKGWLSMGEVTQAFEQEFAAYIGVRHAFAVSNGTVALHMACLAAEVGPGDEVIVPSLTFVATANAVAYTGATPVFADVSSPQDLTISPNSIAAHITSRTKAIIVMHYGGYPCWMEDILKLAERHGLTVIEDDAHAPGAELIGRRMGNWGLVGCFSFFSNKNMTTGEGGMLTTNNDHIAEKLGWLRSHGMTTLTWDRHRGHAWSYDVVAPGYNYRMDEIRAALGRVQLKKLEANNSHRKELVAQYTHMLSTVIPEVEIPFIGHPGESAYHLMVILLPAAINRVHFMEGMKIFGIQTSVHYPPVHHFSYYRKWLAEQTRALSVTEDAANRVVSLPLFGKMNSGDVEEVTAAIRKVLNKLSNEELR